MIVLWITGDKQILVRSRVVTVPPRWAFSVGSLLIVAAVLNGVWIGPQTDWFRLQSPADKPLGMEVPMQVTFAQGYTLLGYTLHDRVTAPGEPLSLTLYWLPLHGTNGLDYYPVVQFVNLRGTKAWASTEFPFVGTTPYSHSPQRFISQKVNLTLFDDAPPFVGRLDVRLVDWETGEWVLLANGADDRVLLPDVIPITGTAPTVAGSEAGYLIADAIELVDTNIHCDDQTLMVDLTWQIHRSLPLDNVKVFIHAFDETGNLVQQLDAPPFGGDYPARYWRADQTLSQTYRLPIAVGENVTQLALGMYTPENRLPVTLTGQPVQDGLIILAMP